MKLIVGSAIAVALFVAAGAFAQGTASADGQAIGQDEVRLALTRCSNAGGGNGGEFEAAVGPRSILSDCLNKRLGSRYTADEVAAILAQANCVIVGPLAVCEVDPGNSAAHNNAGP
jgi:hypothetical protein